MDDTELLDALRTGLDGADPPGPAVRAAAIRAGRWDGRPDVQAIPSDREPVLMRNSSIDTSLTFSALGYEIDVTIGPRLHADDGAVVRVVIAPAVAGISVLEPGADARTVAPSEPGNWSFDVTHRLVAISFQAADGTLVQTPLLDTEQ